MKSILFIGIVLFLAFQSHSQNFIYKEIIHSGHSVKMEGTLMVSDSIIRLTGPQFDITYKVELKVSAGDVKQFMVIEPKSNGDTRMTLNASKKNPMFMMESKDNFTNQILSTIYKLELKDE